MVLENVNIRVPVGMKIYLESKNPKNELRRNALLLYPYIENLTISHGKAAEILGISKNELIEIYDSMGLAYLNQDISEVEEEIVNWRKLKEELA